MGSEERMYRKAVWWMRGDYESRASPRTGVMSMYPMWLHRALPLEGPQSWINILQLTSWINVLKFLLIFEWGASDFHFAQCPANYATSPLPIATPKNITNTTTNNNGETWPWKESNHLIYKSIHCVNTSVMKGILKLMKNILAMPFANKRIIECI